jgi:hypothetical protein
MRILAAICFVGFLQFGGAAHAQETDNADTSAVERIHRPHILYVEIIGRAAYWNVGYGYTFFQKDKHELNSVIGVNFIWNNANHYATMIPVGLFYRYGHRIKVEAGFSVTPNINLARIIKGSHYYLHGEYTRRISHQVNLIPSIGIVYGSVSKKFEVGIRYTPYLNPIHFENSIPYVFGAFFNIRLKQRQI